MSDMARYIDIEPLIENLKLMAKYQIGERQQGILGVIESIRLHPTADVAEVKHGEWKQGVPYVCSICGKPAPDEKNTDERYSCWSSPYCPHCGAKMDGERKENE